MNLPGRFVLLRRSLAVSWPILAAHPLRTLLAVAGVAVGVASVTATAAAGRAAERRVVEKLRSLGTNSIVVNAAPVRAGAGARPGALLEVRDAERLAEECPAVEAAAAAVARTLLVKAEDRQAQTTVVGVAPEGLPLRNVAVRAGRAFDEDDERARRRVALVGATVVERLFRGLDPVGLTLIVGRVPFEVIGVTARRGTDANGTDQDDVVVVPLATAMRRLFNVAHVQTIHVRARSEEALGRAERELREALRAAHRVREGRPDPFSIQTPAALLRSEREAAAAMGRMTLGVAGVALGIGGAGILALMLLSVRERRREIGLRRAVGARRRDILAQFLAESFLLSGGGAVLGTLLGLTAGLGLGDPSWRDAALAAGISLAAGVAFGLWPAWRAARLDPAAALR
jgi:putative ABC transport system permease protein